MSSKGVKEYTLKINGIAQSIQDFTKLGVVVKQVDSALDGLSGTADKGVKISKNTTKSLSEEEKAQKKLADTLAKAEKARSGANDEQIRATQALREATREATRRVQISQLEEGSIKRLGMELTDLRNEYYSLNETERENEEIGGKMLARIQEMDAKYKAARESAGQFQDSVGNYERATQGLDKLATNIEGVNKTAMGLAQGLLGSTMVLEMFGDQSEEDAKRALQLQKIIALLSIAEQVNTNVLKEGIVQNKLAAVTDGIRAVQIKAKTAAEALSTKGTIAATVAQKAFNAVAYANPYVLLALALVGVVTGLVAFTSSTAKAERQQKAFNDAIDKTNDLLGRMKDEADFNIAFAEATGTTTEELRKLRTEAADARRETAQATYDMLVTQGANTELVQKAYEALDNAEKEWLQINRANIVEAERERRAALKKAEDDRKSAAEQAAETAKEAAKVETDALRTAEDAKIRIMVDADEKARLQTEATYNRQIEDLQKRLATETNLSTKARAAINATILALETEKEQALDKLAEDHAKARADAELELARQLEDQRTAMILGEYDRRRAEVNIKYDRQIDDLKKRLETDKNLTAESQAYITQLIEGAENARQKELTDISVSETAKRNSQQLALLDDWLSETQQKMGGLEVRDKDGLQLIDVDATRNQLAAANRMWEDYIAGLEKYRGDMIAASDAELASLKQGTPEYEDALLRRSAAMQDLTRRIKEAEDEQTANTQKATQLQGQYYAELYNKMRGYAEQGLQAIGAVTDTVSQALQVQIDGLNAQLEVVNEKYEEAQKRREDSVERVEQLEADLQEATGGTAEALKEQLQEEMANRAEAEREELRLAKEKERREAEIQKKEKQQKRLDATADIAQSIANTALGVTRALIQGWPLGIVMASVIGAMGAAQTAIMVKQLAKMADGGLIVGPSHAQGGARIHGTNIEVEGGEFVVNKASTAANSSLIHFINDARGPVTLSDLIGVVPVEAPPAVTLDTRGATTDQILEAISEINFRPVVGVTDIIDKTNEVTEVRDLAGF